MSWLEPTELSFSLKGLWILVTKYNGALPSFVSIILWSVVYVDYPGWIIQYPLIPLGILGPQHLHLSALSTVYIALRAPLGK